MRSSFALAIYWSVSAPFTRWRPFSSSLGSLGEVWLRFYFNLRRCACRSG